MNLIGSLVGKILTDKQKKSDDFFIGLQDASPLASRGGRGIQAYNKQFLIKLL